MLICFHCGPGDRPRTYRSPRAKAIGTLMVTAKGACHPQCFVTSHSTSVHERYGSTIYMVMHARYKRYTVSNMLKGEKLITSFARVELNALTANLANEHFYLLGYCATSCRPSLVISEILLSSIMSL